MQVIGTNLALMWLTHPFIHHTCVNMYHVLYTLHFGLVVHHYIMYLDLIWYLPDWLSQIHFIVLLKLIGLCADTLLGAYGTRLKYISNTEKLILLLPDICSWSGIMVLQCVAGFCWYSYVLHACPFSGICSLGLFLLNYINIVENANECDSFSPFQLLNSQYFFTKLMWFTKFVI